MFKFEFFFFIKGGERFILQNGLKCHITSSFRCRKCFTALKAYWYTCANICTLQMTRIKMQFLNWKLRIQSDHIQYTIPCNVIQSYFGKKI